jgi:hypothetical protein
MSFWDINWSARASVGVGVLLGQAVCKNTADKSNYLPATSANLAAVGRLSGIAVSIPDLYGIFAIQYSGEVPSSITGLGAGVASPVIVGTDGKLARKASPQAGDYSVGTCDADGDLTLLSATQSGGSGAVIIGPNVVADPTAAGDRALSGGSESVAGGADSIALGTQATTGTGFYNVAIGPGADTSGVGGFVTGTPQQATAIGYLARPWMSGAIALSGYATSVATQVMIATLRTSTNASGAFELTGPSGDDTRFIAGENIPNGQYIARVHASIWDGATQAAIIWSIAFTVDVTHAITIQGQGAQEVLGAGAFSMAADVTTGPGRLRLRMTVGNVGVFKYGVAFVAIYGNGLS